MSLIKKDAEAEYYKEAMSWDESERDALVKSSKRAWIVAFVALVGFLFSIGAVFFMMPLKTVHPFVVRVDSVTGHVDVISTLHEKDKVTKLTAQEALDRYFLSKYVKHRERYDYDTRQYDRNLVGLFSNTKEQKLFAEERNPKTNTAAPVVQYGKTKRALIKIKTINFVSSHKGSTTAIVRFIKNVDVDNNKQKSINYSATLVFKYVEASMKIEDRLINPLGFQVISYRLDRESN